MKFDKYDNDSLINFYIENGLEFDERKKYFVQKLPNNNYLVYLQCETYQIRHDESYTRTSDI